ncbi:hypothetical protein ACMSW1_001054 [Cronobacter dublinensis]
MANGTMSPPLHISFRADGENRAVGKRSASTSRDIPFIKDTSQNLISRAARHHFSLFLTSLHIYVAPLHHHVPLFY